MCSWGLRCASDSELAAAVVEHSVAFRVTSPEDLQLTSARLALFRLLMICKAYDVVVDIWVCRLPSQSVVDDLTVLRTQRVSGNSSVLFVRLSLNSHQVLQ